MWSFAAVALMLVLKSPRMCQAGGAGGFILVNASANQGLALDPYLVPGVHLEYNATALFHGR